MLDVKITVPLVIVDFLLYFCGILFWFSDTFAHALDIVGFFSRLFAGLVSIIIGVIITALIVKGG